MLIVGELINSSRKAIQPAIEAYDTAAVAKLAVAQKKRRRSLYRCELRYLC